MTKASDEASGPLGGGAPPSAATDAATLAAASASSSVPAWPESPSLELPGCADSSQQAKVDDDSFTCRPDNSGTFCPQHKAAVQQDAQRRRPQVTQAVTVPLTAPAASAASSGNGAHGAGHERVTRRADGATFGAGRGQDDAAGIHALSTTTDFGLAAPSTTHAVKGWRAADTQVVWLMRQAPQGAVPKIMPAQLVTTTPVVPQAVLQVTPAVTVPTAAPAAAEQVASSGLGLAMLGVGSGDELCSPDRCLGEV